MDYYYFGIIIILFALTVLNLTVGVANDAVNFLNNAWGSKAASFRVLMITASAGVFVGALFAGGMMEVARSGVFHPQYFVFGEVMMIFLAVMLTNVILIDFFNTLGLPTSTTVSLVAGLLGAAFTYSAIKVSINGEAFASISNYINTNKALAMISAIFISIAVAFFFGVVLQYISRLLFSFSYQRYRIFGGSVFGGISIGLISYFIFFKGLNSTSFIDKNIIEWITINVWLIECALMLILTIVFVLLQAVFRINVFKIVVIYGTFALAMSFAGNDLVNFIGPPLAALDAFNAYTQSGSTEPFLFTMESLQGGAPTPTLFLMASGLIMVITLWTSKKTKTVIRTTVDLGRQNEGTEKFEANPVARSIVKMAIQIGKLFTIIQVPAIHKWAESRFEKPIENFSVDAPAFDLLRAAVGLTVASSLIAIGTSMQLPLSTTYVTFMVAMGTSLADRAWDRESAVFRVSGVVTVIGGWFVTAFIAFIAAGLITLIFHFGGFVGVVLMIALCVLLLVRSMLMHKKREKAYKETESLLKVQADTGEAEIIEMSKQTVYYVLDQIPLVLDVTINGLYKEKSGILKKAEKMVKEVDKRTSIFKTSMNVSIRNLGENYLTVGDYYIKNTDVLREIAVSLGFIINPIVQHVANQHKSLSKSQLKDLHEISHELLDFTSYCKEKIAGDFTMVEFPKLKLKHSDFVTNIQEIRYKQIKRIKDKEAASRGNLLFFNIITEIQNLSKFLVELTENELQFNKLK